MPSTVLTWCTPKLMGAPASDNNHLAVWNVIVAGLQTVDDNADFPWVTCDVNTASTEAHYIVMKPKSGAPGRIVMGNNKNSTKFNSSIQFASSTINPTAATFFAFYIAGATSDILTNLKGTGPLFTGEDLVNSTPIVYNQYLTGTTSQSVVALANEEAILIVERRNDAPELQYSILIGGILVNDADEPYNGVICNPASTRIAAPSKSLSQADGSVVWHRRTPTGEPELWGKAMTINSTLHEKLRDLSNKKAYFVPFALGSFHAITPDRTFYFTLRQIGLGPTIQAASEELRDGAGTLKAFCPYNGAATSDLVAWLCNFKLNV